MGCLVIMMAGNPRSVDAQVKRALLIGINTYRPDDKYGPGKKVPGGRT